MLKRALPAFCGTRAGIGKASGSPQAGPLCKGRRLFLEQTQVTVCHSDCLQSSEGEADVQRAFSVAEILLYSMVRKGCVSYPPVGHQRRYEIPCFRPVTRSQNEVPAALQRIRPDDEPLYMAPVRSYSR